MDEIDYQILEILKKNSREKFVTIGEKVNLTEGAVRRRIEKMIEEKTIERFTVETNVEFEGMVLIKTERGEIPKVRKKAEALAEKIFELAGDYDIAVLIQSFTMERLNEKVDDIRSIPGVVDTKTLIKLAD